MSLQVQQRVPNRRAPKRSLDPGPVGDDGPIVECGVGVSLLFLDAPSDCVWNLFCRALVLGFTHNSSAEFPEVLIQLSRRIWGYMDEEFQYKNICILEMVRRNNPTLLRTRLYDQSLPTITPPSESWSISAPFHNYIETWDLLNEVGTPITYDVAEEIFTDSRIFYSNCIQLILSRCFFSAYYSSILATFLINNLANVCLDDLKVTQAKVKALENSEESMREMGLSTGEIGRAIKIQTIRIRRMVRYQEFFVWAAVACEDFVPRNRELRDAFQLRQLVLEKEAVAAQHLDAMMTKAPPPEWIHKYQL